MQECSENIKPSDRPCQVILRGKIIQRFKIKVSGPSPSLSPIRTGEARPLSNFLDMAHEKLGGLQPGRK